MKRFLLAVSSLLVVGCAARNACPTVDPQRLADAVAREIVARVAAANEEPPEGELPGELEDDEVDVAGTRVRVPIDGRPSLGLDTAPVTIVVFSDFECPFCARVQPTLEELFRRYPGQLRLVFRNEPLPFHSHARAAAEAAMEAYAQRGDDGFWAMHDLLFENQRSLEREDLERYARRLELDLPTFRTALETERHAGAIDDDLDLAERVGARGTPNFFVNGRQLVGAQPLEAFVDLITEELETARELVARGVPAERVYETLMADAADRAAPPPPSAPSAAPPRPDPAATYRIELSGDEPQRGRDDALVTIVEWSDFQCPFCGRVGPTLETLRTQYGNDLRIVFLHNPLPFHENAMPAALAAAEAQAQGGDRKFWQMHDLLFAHQDALTRDDLESYARQLHLDLRRFRRALDERTHQAAIEAQQAMARRFGAGGTPAFFVNGRFLGGAQPIEVFRRLVDEEMSEARALVASGVRRRDVYARIVADGLTTLAAAVDDGEAGDARDTEAEDVPTHAIPLPLRPITLGPDDAPITIQVFTDYQCPFCGRLEPTLAELRLRYGGLVRVVHRDYPLPFHTNAAMAAEAGREVREQGGLEAFWRFREMLFEHQNALDRASLESYAQALGGIDMARFRRALDVRKHRDAVEADAAAIRDAGIEAFGTPTTFVEDRMISGAQSIDRFVAVIDELLRSRGLPVPEAPR